MFTKKGQSSCRAYQGEDEKDTKVSPNNMFTKQGQSFCRAYQGEDEKETKVSADMVKDIYVVPEGEGLNKEQDEKDRKVHLTNIVPKLKDPKKFY
jgi:hypothetical protein